jgi:hypothetical protein
VSGILTPYAAGFKPHRPIVTMFVNVQERDRCAAISAADDVVAVEHGACLVPGHRHGYALAGFCDRVVRAERRRGLGVGHAVEARLNGRAAGALAAPGVEQPPRRVLVLAPTRLEVPPATSTVLDPPGRPRW